MWMKLMAPALTSVVGLSLAAVAPQDEPAKVEVTKHEVTEGHPVGSTVVESSDSGDELADVYNRLIKVRAMRLADRPKKLSDEAAGLYRQAVGAVEKGEEDKARALTKAASELTKALEISLKIGREEPSDPELPPPPRRSDRKVYFYSAKTKAGEEIPPALRYTVKTPAGEEAAANVIRRYYTPFGKAHENQAKMEAHGNVRVHVVTPEDGQPKRDVIVERIVADEEKVVRHLPNDDAAVTLKGALANRIKYRAAVTEAEAARAQAEASRAAAKSVLTDVVKDLDLQVRLINEKKKKEVDEKVEVKLSDEKLERLTRTQSLARLHEALAGMHGAKEAHEIRVQVVGKDGKDLNDADKALSRLREAHRVIVRLRDAHKGEEASSHLEAARDLYNAARHEAEAKRFGRAEELAKAAEALAGVDKTLHEMHVEARIVDDKGNVKVLRNLINAREAKGDAVVVVGKPEKAEAAAKVEHGESDEAGPIQGVGVQLSFDEGKGGVQELIAGGPAATDGRIKPGDSIVGIETENGATLGFADKSLVEVTKLLRGPVGSKVKLIVQPKGSNDRKVYELERQKLNVPKPEAAAKPEGEGGDGPLPPVID